MAQTKTIHNWKAKLIRFPQEDFSLIGKTSIKETEEIVLSIADGVTKDCKNGEVADKSLKGLKNIAMHYPNPSPAFFAAHTFCYTITSQLSNILNPPEPTDIKNSFKLANNYIKNLWPFSEIDFLANDYPGCTAATCVYDKETNLISWGFISDCGLALFDANGNLKERTPNQGPHSKEKNSFLEKVVKIHGGWTNSEARKQIRSMYRNNPYHEAGFGVLTGQPEALKFVNVGTWNAKPGDHLFLYTDGMENTIYSPNSVQILKQDRAEEQTFKHLVKLGKKEVKTEGTIIYHQIPFILPS